MTYHSEMASLVEEIESVRRSLQRLVIDRQKYQPTWVSNEHWDFWHRHAESLFYQLDRITEANDDVRDELYRRGISDIKRSEKPEKLPIKQKDAGLPPLTAKQQKALDFVRMKGSVKGVLISRHIKVSYPRFRSAYVPILKKHGLLNNKDGDGYYVSET